MIHNSSKLQLWSSNEDNFVVVVSTTRGAVLKGHRVKMLRTTVYHTHTNSLGCTFFIRRPFNRCKLYLSKAAGTEGKLTNSNSEEQRWEKDQRRKLRPEDDKLLGLHSGNNVSKTETEWLKKGKKNKRFSWQLSKHGENIRSDIRYCYLEGILSDSQAKN